MIRLHPAIWFAAACVAATPARAQIAGSVGIESDYRLRGYSISGEDPAVAATLSYDHASGIYASGLVIVSPAKEKGVAGYQANIGYARSLSPRVSIEGGVLRTQYARTPGDPLRLAYTEAYTGVTRGAITARVYYSPDYFRADTHTLYAEVEARLRLAPGWNVNAHLGGLTYLSDPPRYSARSRYDWRATLSHAIGPFDVHAGLSGRGSGGDYYVRSRDRMVVTGGASFAF